jgi:2-hydroxychromene-2-carboxylate isomerase
MPQPIEFFFDFSSPYGYLASREIDALGAKYGREVVWKPILLGAVFKLTGGIAQVSVPIKGDYARHDFIRFARLLGVEFKLPDPFPFSSIHAVRAFWWLEGQDPTAAHDLAQHIYNKAFAGGGDIASAQSIASAAAEIGIDGAALLAGIESQEIKDRTRTENDAAIARGVFGSPFIVVDGEAFWGADRSEQVGKWLDTGGW